MAVANYYNDLGLWADTSLFPGANDLFTLSNDLGTSYSGYTPPTQIPGFSDVPLVVDVVSSSPDPMNVSLGNLEQAAGTRINEVLGGIPVNGFTSIPSGGGIDFPSARPTDPLGNLISGAFGLASSLISTGQEAPIGRISTGITGGLCAPGMKPRKTPVKARKSAVQPCVARRHMNSLNPHALRRATRRLNGFMSHVKSAQKAIHKALGHALPRAHRQPARRGCVQCGRPARSCVC